MHVDPGHAIDVVNNVLFLSLSQIVSHDTRKFRFALPSAEHVLGLPVGEATSFFCPAPPSCCF